MADNTKIEWTEATWNPITGCTVTSPGCTNCYAMKLAGTRLAHHESRAGLTTDSKAGPVWNGQVRFNEQWLDQPLRWKRPRMIFVCAHGDLFHESVPDAWIDRVFAVMALCPHHTFQVLTKRSDRMREYLTAPLSAQRIARVMLDNYRDWGVPTLPTLLDALANRASEESPSIAAIPLPNVWLGVSVEDQARADQRIPDLLATPAAVRWLSCEPLLGPVDLTRVNWGGEWSHCWTDALAGIDTNDQQPGEQRPAAAHLDWIVAGGESGAGMGGKGGARPMHPDWARSLRDQCAAAGVPFFFKQWGDWVPVCEMTEELIESCYHPAPERQPEATRRCRVNQCVLHGDGERFNGEAMFQRPAFEHGSGAMTMFEVGKKRAGRLLDGQLHDALPEVAA